MAMAKKRTKEEGSSKEKDNCPEKSWQEKNSSEKECGGHEESGSRET